MIRYMNNESATDAKPQTESEHPIPESYDEIPKTADHYRTPDPTLQDVSYFANRARAGMSLTFFTAAGTFSGNVISAEEFYEETGAIQLSAIAEMDDDKREPAEQYVDMFFNQTATIYRDMREEARDDDEYDPTATRFIHLRNANIQLPSGRLDSVGLVRILLAHVIAWKPGMFANPS